MNPTQPTPAPLPERQPITPTQPETPGAPTPERPAPSGFEQAPQPGQPAGAPPVPVVPPTLPAVPVPPPVAPGAPPVPAQAPLAGPPIADDVDVIEKEWVDEANKIISATSGDPYVEEEAMEDLQVDYLKKRYGKEIKKDQAGSGQPPV